MHCLAYRVDCVNLTVRPFNGAYPGLAAAFARARLDPATAKNWARVHDFNDGETEGADGRKLPLPHWRKDAALDPWEIPIVDFQTGESLGPVENPVAMPNGVPPKNDGTVPALNSVIGPTILIGKQANAMAAAEAEAEAAQQAAGANGGMVGTGDGVGGLGDADPFAVSAGDGLDGGGAGGSGFAPLDDGSADPFGNGAVAAGDGAAMDEFFGDGSGGGGGEGGDAMGAVGGAGTGGDGGNGMLGVGGDAGQDAVEASAIAKWRREFSELGRKKDTEEREAKRKLQDEALDYLEKISDNRHERLRQASERMRTEQEAFVAELEAGIKEASQNPWTRVVSLIDSAADLAQRNGKRAAAAQAEFSAAKAAAQQAAMGAKGAAGPTGALEAKAKAEKVRAAMDYSRAWKLALSLKEEGGVKQPRA